MRSRTHGGSAQGDPGGCNPTRAKGNVPITYLLTSQFWSGSRSRSRYRSKKSRRARGDSGGRSREGPSAVRPAARRGVTPVKDQGARLGGGSAVEAALCRVTGSQGHRVKGSRGHRVTGSQGSQGHRVTGSQGHRSQGHKVTGSHGHRVTGPQGHGVTGSQRHRVTRSQGHKVLLAQGVLVVLVVKLY